jgi:hypothetical protein
LKKYRKISAVAAADGQNKSETYEPTPPKPESFALAAAEGEKKFEFFSRRRRLKHRLTPLGVGG